MAAKEIWKKILFIAGIIALLGGAIDPIEGSIVILAGSIMIFLYALLTGDRFINYFLASLIMIAVGVILMFLFSWFGGFGGDDAVLPMWLIFLIVPYPAGWFMEVVMLVVRAVRMHRKR